MGYTWRTAFANYIKDHYNQKPNEWFDINISTSGMVNVTIVSDNFKGISLPQRREEIQQLLRENEVPMPSGFLSLYTVQEAESIGLTKMETSEEDPLYSWYDLASRAANFQGQPKRSKREPRVPRTIAFYSFKGGVGRTTALTHVAWILAKRGRKVVAVDLDMEAPGLGSAMRISPIPPYGIVDYFYERSYLPEGVNPAISITEIFSEVRIPDAIGRLFVVPAGTLSLDYIAKVDDLRSTAITERGEDLWSTFYREITEQLQPDIILIDSRTGINEWGAFSLLRAADKAIVFLYPNEQNRHGIELLLEALANNIPLQLVFSPVPLSEAGTEKVAEYWQILQGKLDGANNQDKFDLDEEVKQEDEPQSEFAEPITIQYLTELALAPGYPVEPLLSHYMSIANVVDEDTTTFSLERVLADSNHRRKVLKSLEFPEVDATTNQNLNDLFQRTADFERFLDDTACLIRGRKGTGKSTLYWLLLKYPASARELSHRRLESVTFLSGHGRYRVRPTRDEFKLIGQTIEQDGSSWEAFWRSYLLLRMHMENMLQPFFKGNSMFTRLRTMLNQVPKDANLWRSEHTNILLEMATNAQLNLLAKDMLNVINTQLSKNNRVFWFLYDDLDEDLLDKGEIRERVLTGLLQFVQACDARRLKSVCFKIFLREDIWNRLIFDNKSHFNGRDIMLQWTRKDFLRLALRQALQSKDFEDLVGRFSPVGDIDQADEAAIDRALQLLWGSRREQNLKSKNVSRWVYDRLTDSSNTTFPRSLNILLKVARDFELEIDRGQSPITDRLLRPKSLNEGLVQASVQRCNELREEYRELTPFFNSLVNSAIVISADELREIWQGTLQAMPPEFREFRKFVDFLVSIGLIGLAEREKKPAYRFAEIYTHGFGISRSTRKY